LDTSSGKYRLKKANAQECASFQPPCEAQDWIEQVRNLNMEYTLQTGSVRKFRIDVFGCQMNERDAETLSGLLVNMGFEQVYGNDPAQLILFVTCCVRENAEERIFGHIGALSHECENNGSIIISCGCMMQQPHIVEKIKKSYPNVKIVFGTHNVHTFPELLYRYMTKRKRVFSVWEKEGQIVEDLPVQRTEKHKAWVNIVYGCNNFCSYCIVPHVRGRERSRNWRIFCLRSQSWLRTAAGRSPSWGRTSIPMAMTLARRTFSPGFFMRLRRLTALSASDS